MKVTELFLEEFKKEMRHQYGYISYSLSDKQIKEWLKEHKRMSVKQTANFFSDYLLANGLADEVQL